MRDPWRGFTPSSIKLTITREAHNAIRAAARNEFHDTSRENPDGTLTIRISMEVLKGLVEMRQEGETSSDTIIRLAATQGGLN